MPVNQHQANDMPIQKSRKWVRRLAKLEAEFVLAVCSAMIRDISRGGFRLTSIVLVESGMTIRIRLNSGREARVVHVSRETRGQWSMSCAFSEEISSEDVQQLLTSHS